MCDTVRSSGASATRPEVVSIVYCHFGRHSVVIFSGRLGQYEGVRICFICEEWPSNNNKTNPNGAIHHKSVNMYVLIYDDLVFTGIVEPSGMLSSHATFLFVPLNLQYGGK